MELVSAKILTLSPISVARRTGTTAGRSWLESRPLIVIVNDFELIDPDLSSEWVLYRVLQSGHAPTFLGTGPRKILVLAQRDPSPCLKVMPKDRADIVQGGQGRRDRPVLLTGLGVHAERGRRGTIS
jgi:hypothetical protein